MYMYVDGKIVRGEKAMVSAYDHGYMYGVGLFETFRVIDGHPFLLDDHLKRLQQGLNSVGIQWTYSRQKIVAIIKKLLTLNELQEAYVRLNVSAGEEEVGLFTGTYTKPVTIIYMKKLPQSSPYKDGALLTLRRNSPEGSRRLKSHHYLNNLLAKRELKHSPHVEGIFLTKEGYVAEGIVSNVFWLRDGIVYTSTTKTGILNGVTRQFVLTLLHNHRYQVRIGFFPFEHLQQAEAAFITNAIIGVVPLRCMHKTMYNQTNETILHVQRLYKHYRTHLWSKDEIAGGHNGEITTGKK